MAAKKPDPEPEGVPTKDWAQRPISDSADFLDRDAPRYVEGDAPGGAAIEPKPAPMRLPSADAMEAHAKAMFTGNLIMREDGTLVDRKDLPVIYDPVADEDTEG